MFGRGIVLLKLVPELIGTHLQTAFLYDARVSYTLS